MLERFCLASAVPKIAAKPEGRLPSLFTPLRARC